MTKILLIEDNEMNRDMLSRRLIRKGYEVDVAIDGQEGLTKASTAEHDVILMDITLPFIDGYELTQRIKANQNTRTIPIIALTANATIEDRTKALSVGCDEFEPKPIDFERLLSKIDAFADAKIKKQIL